MTRKLVTVRKIDDIQSIEGADLIVKATVDGWNIVVKKDEFSVGDYCVMFEIDSFLPIDDDRYEFLKKSSYKKMNGQEGLRLKTVKLRGVVSQGLVLPVDRFPEIQEYAEENGGLEVIEEERHDLSELLGVVKYEIPDVGKGCKPAGNFPWYVSKTDEERLENLYKDFSVRYKDVAFTPTLKLDGSSTTLVCVNNENYFFDSEETDNNGFQAIVCSRNLALKYDPESMFWKGWENDDLVNNIKQWTLDTGIQVAVQGELMGPGVQGNKEQLHRFRVYAFRVYNIDEQRFMNLDEMKTFCNDVGMYTTVIYDSFKPFSEFESLDEIMRYADGPSINSKNREGLVYVSEDENGERISFKTISRKFLLKSEE